MGWRAVLSVAERSPMRNQIPRRSQHAVGAAFGRLRPQDASAGGAENEIVRRSSPGARRAPLRAGALF